MTAVFYTRLVLVCCAVLLLIIALLGLVPLEGQLLRRHQSHTLSSADLGQKHTLYACIL